MRRTVTGAAFGALLMALALMALASPCFAGGDPVRGERIYERCEGCHSLDRDRVGPRHKGVVGRRAASIDGFAYSPAMKSSGLTWDEMTLDRFLQGPTKLVPGTRMGFAGVPNEQDRADLIAFLKKAGASSPGD